MDYPLDVLLKALKDNDFVLEDEDGDGCLTLEFEKPEVDNGNHAAMLNEVMQLLHTKGFAKQIQVIECGDLDLSTANGAFDFSIFPELKYLAMESCHLSMPPNLAQCPKLQLINLKNNKLQAPPNIDNLNSLLIVDLLANKSFSKQQIENLRKNSNKQHQSSPTILLAYTNLGSNLDVDECKKQSLNELLDIFYYHVQNINALVSNNSEINHMLVDDFYLPGDTDQDFFMSSLTSSIDNANTASASSASSNDDDTDDAASVLDE